MTYLLLFYDFSMTFLRLGVANIRQREQFADRNDASDRILHNSQLTIKKEIYISMKKTYLLSALVAISAIGLSASPALARWAAIAYSRTTGTYSTAWRHYTSNNARDRALSNCNKRDCRVELLFENKCGGLARKRNNTEIVVAGYSNNSRTDAGNQAIANCGSNCQLVTVICSNTEN